MTTSTRGRRRHAGLAVLCVAMLVAAGCDWVTLASVSSNGAAADAASSEPDLSGDGRYVVFVSAATTLGANPGGQSQVWWRDLRTKETRLVSGAGGCAGAGCVGGSGFSRYPTVSADGRYVAFSSRAPDLVAGPPTALGQVYRADMVTGTHQPVSVAPSGEPGNGNSTLYGRDLSDQKMSGDGDTIVFQSSATDLGPGGPGSLDLFVHTVSTNTTVLLSSRNDIDSYEMSDDGTSVVVGYVDVYHDENSPQITIWSDVEVIDSDGSGRVRVLDAFLNDVFAEGGQVIGHATVDADGSHVLLGVADNDYYPARTDFRLFDLSSGVATQTQAGISPDDGVVLDLDPDGTHALIRLSSNGGRTYRCSTGAIAACLNAASTFPATNGLGTAVAHTSPVASDDGRVFAWVSASTLPLITDTNGLADLYVSAAALTITDVQISTPLLPGGTATATITGSGFAVGDTTVSAGHQPGQFSMGQVTVSSSTSLSVEISASGNLTPGLFPLSVFVTNPDVSPTAISFDRCTDCFAVDISP